MASYYTSGYTPPAGVTDANEVKKIQQQLTQAGYNIGSAGIDGIWGKDTQAAYDAYRANGTNRTSGGAVTMQPVTVTPDWSVPADMLDSVGSAQGSAQSGATSTYQQSAYGLPSVPTYDIGAAYDRSAEQYKAALDAAYEAQKANIDAQAAKLDEQYNALRQQAYVNARLNAIGNNERMAAMGLAGNMYDGPLSGTSESSRVAENIGMRNDINAATRQEQSERDTLALELLQAGYTRDVEYAKWMADMMIAKAQAEQAAAQQAFENQMALAQMYSSMYGSSGSSGGSSGRSSSSSGSGSTGTIQYKDAKNYLEYLAKTGASKKQMSSALSGLKSSYALPDSQWNVLNSYIDILAKGSPKPSVSGKLHNSYTE